MNESQKLFVGGLPWVLTEEEFREAFEVFGVVTEAKIVTDRETNRSRGFGFISFGNADDAKTALENLHGTELKGREIRVDFAEKKDDSRDRGRSDDRSSSSRGPGRRDNSRGRR